MMENIFNVLVVCLWVAWPSPGLAERIPLAVPATVAERLSKGEPQDLIVLFDDRDVETEASGLRQRAGKAYDDDSILAFRRVRYRSIKQATAAEYTPHEVEELRDYAYLPMSLIRVKSRSALERLLADPRVQAVYEDRPVYPHLTYSLPFIGQPTAANAGYGGSGQTVAVLDTGIDYTLPAFGSCTAPGVPVGCRVVASVDVTGHNVTLNTAPNNHGTNVAGIVAGVGSGTRVAAINAFYNGGSTTSWIIDGINWAIANKSSYTIGALNMSLGDNVNYNAPCGNKGTNPYVTPINNLRAAGIIPVASSGNNGYSNGMGIPACTPGVVSVGAVYDANWGGVTWNTSGCTDATSAPDRILCSSNSASFLTMLAPGAFITAAGIQAAGTSQAAPHVAGALAVLRAAYTGDTLDQAVGRLTSSGVPVTDSRNGITKPRLNLSAAISPPVVTVAVSGTGTVTSSSTTTGIPSDISCNSGTCSASYPSNSKVDLTATPPWYATVGWSGCAASGNNCSVVLDTDKTVSAMFSKDRNVMLSANPYATIQEAYGFCNPSGTLLVRDSSQVTFLENLDFNKDYTITLNGGMDASFQPTAGFTVIKGSMKISAGKVVVNKIMLQQ